MRRFLRHLQDRPEISDDTLRLALGFDRATLATLADALGPQTQAMAPAPPHGAGLGAAQAPMQASFGHPADTDMPAAAPAANAATRAGGCCGGKRRD